MPSRRTLLVLLLRSTHGFFEASRESAGGVIEVDAESWAATVVASEKPAFVMWYSPTRGTASGAVAMTRSGESTPHLTPSPRRAFTNLERFQCRGRTARGVARQCRLRASAALPGSTIVKYGGTLFNVGSDRARKRDLSQGERPVRRDTTEHVHTRSSYPQDSAAVTVACCAAASCVGCC